MQKRNTRGRALSDAQRGPAPAPAAVPARGRQEPTESFDFGAPSSEMSLGGHADRGLTLAALYDMGLLGRLRLGVRARLMVDLTVSLAWLHENPRLMASQSHLVVAPNAVLIGLDGVARIDVRAAKKGSTTFQAIDPAYAAPELLGGSGAGDHRASIFSLGVLTWEALAGRRLSEVENAQREQAASPERDDEPRGAAPSKIAGPAARVERDPARRRTTLARATSQTSHARLRALPVLTLSADAEWALPLLEVAMQAMRVDVRERAPDCRGLLARLEQLDTSYLATHQEIAEVVQGISDISTLCEPEPVLPNVDASCGAEDIDPAIQAASRAVCEDTMPVCQNPPVKPALCEIAPPVPQAAEGQESLPPALDPQAGEPRLSETSTTLRKMGLAHSARAWFLVGLLWLATLGLVAGYAASRFAAH